VALNRIEYVTKLESMLSDSETYNQIKKDPVKIITKDIRTVLTSWKSK